MTPCLNFWPSSLNCRVSCNHVCLLSRVGLVREALANRIADSVMEELLLSDGMPNMAEESEALSQQDSASKSVQQLGYTTASRSSDIKANNGLRSRPLIGRWSWRDS